MKNGQCSKRFPKLTQIDTDISNDDYYKKYNKTPVDQGVE